METYVIERLGLHGDGIAPGPLYAARALPGEEIAGQVEGNRITDIRIVSPTPDRVAPSCRHFKSCGGCQLQHASDAFVAGWKVDVVKHALAAHGLEARFRPVITSPPRTRRRAVFSARRTKKGALAGFHAPASDQIVATPDCRLVDPALLPAIPLAERLALIGASRRGELNVTATVSLNGLDIAVEGGLVPDGPMLIALAQEAEASDLARLTWNREPVATRRPPAQSFDGVEVVPPPGTFLQATKEGEDALRNAVYEALAGADAVLDLFAGCGTFALPLAKRARVHAVEGSAQMIRALDAGWRKGEGLKRVTSTARDLFREPLLPDELSGFDACVIDPPRAGAEAQTGALAWSGIGKIAYVSCDPRSFARDAAGLVAAGYAIDWLQVVDQFRWSTHVELVASLSLTSA